MPFLDEEVDALGRELTLRGLEELEQDVTRLNRVRIADQPQEPALEVDRDLLGDAGEVAGIGDEGGLGRLEGLGAAEQLGEVVAHRGPVKAFGGVELVGLADGLGEAVEDGPEVTGAGLAVDGSHQFLGESNAAAGGAGARELLADAVFGGDGRLAHNVAFGLLNRDGEARVLGDLLAGSGPPLLELLLAENLSEDDFQLDGGGGLVRVGLEGLDHQLGRLVGDQLVDAGGLGLAADQQVAGVEHLHRGDAEGRIHRVAGLALKVDREPLGGLVVGADLTEAPAPVDNISARHHRLEFRFGRLEGRHFGEERGNGFGIHGCVTDDLNGRVERTFIRLVKPSVASGRPGKTP